MVLHIKGMCTLERERERDVIVGGVLKLSEYPRVRVRGQNDRGRGRTTGVSLKYNYYNKQLKNK